MTNGPDPRRWSAWAAARSGRWRRAERRGRSARMTVLGLGLSSSTVAVHRSCTHLHLATRQAFTPTTAPAPVRGETRPRRTERALALAVAVARSTTPAPAGAAPVPPRPAGAAAAGRRFAGRPRPVVRQFVAGGVLALPPAREPEAGSTGSRGPAGLAAVVARVVHGTRRVEVAARPVRAVQHRAAEPAPAEATAEPGRRSSPADRVAGRPATEPAGPALDLDRLTDSIVTRLDSRLTAHRERFGRAF